jgi:hypothetical protein
MYKTRELNKELRNSQMKANALFADQKDFISKNHFLSSVETTLQISQAAIILFVIYLYFSLHASIQGRINKKR